MSITRHIAKFTLARILLGLVVIGLVIGGMVMGLSSGHASDVEKEIADLTRFDLATKAFRDKYGYLPGDMPAMLSMQLQFTKRAGSAGHGDGNGLLEGASDATRQVSGTIQSGEPLLFWEDLFSADLIKDVFNENGDGMTEDVGADNLRFYLPAVIQKRSDYLYVYSDKHVNYYGLSAVKSISAADGSLISHPGLTVKEAYDIDKKMDDGVPTTGKIVARYIDGPVLSAPSAPASSPATCFDSSSNRYSTGQNGGSGVNCGISFVMSN